MHKPSRQDEFFELIKARGPITSQDIAFRMNISSGSVSFYAGSLKGKIRVGAWEETRSITGKRILSRMWVVGKGKDAPKLKVSTAKIAPRGFWPMDLELMPFRSVFAGGINPWSGVAA